MEIRPSAQQFLPPVVKNLLIINGLFFVATFVLKESMNIYLPQYLALFYIEFPLFKPWQLITHMFMHFDLTHLFFNMFALWMFGVVLENRLGSKRFLQYYLIAGVGSALINMIISGIQVHVFKDMSAYASMGQGASGAIYGLLFAFGYLFPNAILYLYFAIPVKAKYAIIGMALIGVFAGIGNLNASPEYGTDGDIIPKIDHFAHLSGMLAGFIIFKVWKIRYNAG